MRLSVSDLIVLSTMKGNRSLNKKTSRSSDLLVLVLLSPSSLFSIALVRFEFEEWFWTKETIKFLVNRYHSLERSQASTSSDLRSSTVNYLLNCRRRANPSELASSATRTNRERCSRETRASLACRWVRRQDYRPWRDCTISCTRRSLDRWSLGTDSRELCKSQYSVCHRSSATKPAKEVKSYDIGK